MGELLVERNGAVVVLRLNRPDMHNAQQPSLWRELRRVGADLLDDATVNCVVVLGNGPSFSSGLDRRALAEGAMTPYEFTGDERDRDRGSFETYDINAAQEAFRWLADGPFLTVAGLHGFVLGAGAQLALACDLRIVADDTQFALPETDLRFLPDMGATATLPRIVGYSRALELILTARRIDAAEMAALGLATSVVPADLLESAVDALAQRVGSLEHDSVRFSKQAVRAGVDGDAARSYEVVTQGALRLLPNLPQATWQR